ncbi:MAG: GNAT family N-acetyltransferase, partial [Paracoccaceae bacterium]
MQIGARDTVRLQLRPIAAEDLDFAAGLFSLPQMVSHRPDPSPEPRAALRDRLAMDRVHWRTHGFGRWLLSDGGGPVGLGGLTLKDGFEGLNISFHIHPDHWGKGYATEFGREALAVAFGPLAAARVIGLA